MSVFVAQHEEGISHGTIPFTASILLGTLGIMSIGTAPLSMGAMVEAGRLTTSAIGRVATSELLMLALGGVLGPFILSRGSMRLWLVAAAAALLVANLLTHWGSLPYSIYAIRASAGFVEGILMSSTMLMIASSRRADRANAIYLAASTPPQVIANYALALYLIPQFGDVVAFSLLTGLAAIGIGAAFLMPEKAPYRSVPADTALVTPWNTLSIMVGSAVFLHNAAIGCIWYYLERLGAMAGASHLTIGLAAALFLAAQFFGASSAASKRNFYRNPYSLFYLSILLTLVSLSFLVFRTGAPFVTAASMYGFFQIILAPCAVQLMIAFDRSGKTTAQILPITILGLSAGSFLSSFVVSAQDVSPSYWLGALLMLTGGVISGIAVWLGHRRHA